MCSQPDFFLGNIRFCSTRAINLAVVVCESGGLRWLPAIYFIGKRNKDHALGDWPEAAFSKLTNLTFWAFIKNTYL
jgi:hypothetical protein